MLLDWEIVVDKLESEISTYKESNRHLMLEVTSYSLTATKKVTFLHSFDKYQLSEERTNKNNLSVKINTLSMEILDLQVSVIMFSFFSLSVIEFLLCRGN